MPGQITIMPATPDDIDLVMHLIRALAEYEHELDSAQATPEQLHEALFGPNPAAEAVIARLDGTPAGWPSGSKRSRPGPAAPASGSKTSSSTRKCAASV